MSSSAAAAQFKLDANSNAIALIADAAAAQSLPLPLTLPLSLPLPLPLPPSSPTLPATATATPADRIEWSRSTILNFIEDYRRQRVLWDPNTKGYHIKQTKYEALKLLSGKYGTEIRSIRSKIKSLRSSFHREHGKVLSGRSRGVHYQPMWFAYEAIRFILDGERDHDQDPEPEQASEREQDQERDRDRDRELDLDREAETEVDEKLALMHSLDLEQLKADKQQQQQQQQVERDRELHAEELTARIAATVAAVAAAAAAANARDRERDRDRDADSVAGDAMDTATGDLDLEEASGAVESSSAAVTRSSSDLDGENYCNISAEDVKTEIIEHESELGMLDRRTSTPSPINYYKPTDLTYNHRKRKAMDECSGVVLGGVMGVEHVVGALTLTPIKASAGERTGGGGNSSQQQQQQMNHSQLAFQALQQHFSHSHSLSLSHCNGQPQQQQQSLHLQQQQQQQQHQQQHSSNMAQKRDRDRDLLQPPTSNGHSLSNNNTSLDPAATSSTCSSSSNSNATPSKPINGLSSNHVDEYGVFGEYVAITIRKLKTSKSKIVVKHLINNLLYEAELGKYDQGMPASKEPPQLYKMQ